MKEIKRNSLQAWILAARPKTLTGAVTPVLIGTALAAMDRHFEWLPALICCVFASLMQIAANFINDLFDFLKGTDREDRLGPERLCARLDFSSGNENGNHRHGYPCLPHQLYAAFLCGVGADYRRRSLCTLCFSLYNRTLSPILQRLGRCFSNHFFGFVPVGGTYYVQALTWTPDVTVASLVCGLLIDTLLVVNNYRDREAECTKRKTNHYRPFR